MRHIYAVLVAVCGWVLFQLDSVREALGYYKAMFGGAAGGLYSRTDLYYLSGFAAVLAVSVLACTPLGKKLWEKMPKKVTAVAAPVLIVIVLVLVTAYLVDATYNPFLYFRF